MTETSLSDPKVVGYWAYQAIEKHFRKVIKHETDVLKDKDPEALHQMRVGMRRLRTAVTGFAPALSLPKAAREKKIANVARQLGQLRDIDILQDALHNHYLPGLPKSEQKILKKVLETLGKERKHTLKQVQATLSQQRYQNLKQALETWLVQPNYSTFAEFAIDDILPELLLPLVSNFFLHPAWLVGVKLQSGEIEVKSDLSSENVMQLLSTHAETVHDLRKQAKRVRYQMELFTEFYDSTYQDHVKSVKAIQGLLGQIQDSFVLVEFLCKNLNTDVTVELPTLGKQLKETRYQIWQEWQFLQQQYLNAKVRKDLHKLILQPSQQDAKARI
ncbi:MULTISPECIES: CHAD domain-containing protein [unclassified Coleofasciculus]|uniref:CHAD domain-containing protein n=1 Tax=unclassified Coleofasciculus TaxID=2692782 RepID=UPI001882A79E|nr:MULTISPECIES: CHAD domain-containing protein [unclassified Coleofasciculus]MBE9128091.1 CHAD domain-containing protein [Coleofasciculus sp. LEGE 07081]MBE9146964.1 CHAD domain-containing protein [Coleofasciculus sp. LEGE 07092]